MSSTALLVIEGLWWTPEQKPKRPSVLSFLEGLEVTGGILISITPTSTKKTVLNGRFLTTLPIPGRIVSFSTWRRTGPAKESGD